LVMTSAEGVNRRVAMQPNDMSICLGRWRSLTSSQWYRMIECEERTISDGVNPPTDQLRQLRLNFFDRN
jgi:hypothetical protein